MTREKPVVWIAHVPYRERGGEDSHVEGLLETYSSMGFDPILIPENRSPNTYSLGDITSSLSTNGSSPFELPEPSLIHLHNIYPVLGPRFLSSLSQLSAPVIWTIHNHRFYCTNGLALRDLQRCELCKNSLSVSRPILFNCNESVSKSAYYSLALSKVRRDGLLEKISAFIAPSPYIAEELRGFGIREDKIRMIPNPAFFGEAGDREVSPRAGGHKKVIVFSGRLVPEKGALLLPEIARLLPDYEFRIFGDGPLLAELRRKAEITKNLILKGAVPHEKVIAETRSADAAIIPSLCFEIGPFSAIEALAEGVPTYIHRRASSKWLIEKFGAVGVEALTAEAFASALKCLESESPAPLDIASIRAEFSHLTFRSRLIELVKELKVKP